MIDDKNQSQTIPMEDKEFVNKGLWVAGLHENLEMEKVIERYDLVARNELNTTIVETTGDALWTEDGANIYRPTGNVGIGGKPSHKLDVFGTGNFLGWVNSRLYYRLQGRRILHVAGSNNLWLGYETGDSLTTGSENTVIGDGAGGAITSSVSNTIVGYNAGGSVSSGGYNTIVGSGSGYSLTSGTNNVLIGYEAGYVCSTGLNNTLIGYHAGRAHTIGYENAALGTSALASNTWAYRNTAIGFEALTANITGVNNTAVGHSALYTNTTSNDNSAFGRGALYLNNGNSNTALGYYTLYTNSSGNHNTAAGYSALSLATTADDNSAFGSSALANTTIGAGNCAFGRNAANANIGGYGNCAFGYQSLNANQTGYHNTAFGYLALTNVARAAGTTGVGNVGIGYQAGDAITTGSYNVLIGYDADCASAALDNAIAIGQSASVAESDLCVIGKEGTNIQTWGEVRFREPSGAGSNYIGFESPATVAANVIFKLPNADGTANQLLYTDGSANLGWVSAPGILTYLDIPEIAEPSSPAADNLRIFVADVHGYSEMSFKDSGGMVRSFVRDSVIMAYNNSGSTIALGRIVYASGSFNDVPTIALAKSDAAATMPAIGVTIQAIANGAYGRVMQVGLLEDVNTSSFSVGDLLYVSAATAGLPTITRPVYPNISQEIGTIVVDDASVGAIQIVARAVTTPQLHASSHMNTGADVIKVHELFGAGIKSGATQGGAGAAANELWKTNGHATLPDNVVMIGV